MRISSVFKRKSQGSDRASRKRVTVPSHRLYEGQPCITLAVQWGSKGEAVGHRLAPRLGFERYDSEILDNLARQSKVSRDILSALDEDSSTDFSFLVSSLLGSPYVVAEDFGRDLVRIVHQIAENGSCLIMGRGAAFILRGPSVLNVRIIEPFEQRLARLQESRQISYTEAEITLAEIDSARSQFVEDYFKRDIEDPEAYDLVVNAQFLDEEAILDMICRAFEHKRATL
ncbi:cytidylate kinase-like family protein [Candidatus Fermentibacteria bacterium]|nr:cytidylate kinase-like family protein [Candidatus Fermentibacteria bacterium]